MKYFATALFLTVIIFAKAQTVNIPDTNFQIALIAKGVDTNNDGQIQNSEAEAVDSLNFLSTPEPITNFTGIKAFTNLRTLQINSNFGQSATLDVSDLTNLQTVIASNCPLTFLDVTGCTALKVLYARPSEFPSLDVSTCVNLESLIIRDNYNLTTLNIGNIEKLTALDLLGVMHITGSLNLTKCDSLAYLDISDIHHLQTLNISGLNKIESIDDGGMGWEIENLIARNCTGLKTINSGSSPGGVTNLLDVTGCTNLETIFLQEMHGSSVDLSTCINLKSFTLQVVFDNFQYLNIKNGSFTNFTLSGGLSIPLNICADEFELTGLRNQFSSSSFPVTVGSYCSFFPGGNYNTIEGKTSLDLNSNGCDDNDPGMPGVGISISDNAGNSVLRYTAPSGDYAHYPYADTLTLTPYFPYPYFTVNPASALVSFDTANSLTNISNFCIQPIGVHNDLEITFLPSWPAARPGFDAGYTLVYKNRGTTTLSGNVQVNFDNTKMNLLQH